VKEKNYCFYILINEPCNYARKPSKADVSTNYGVEEFMKMSL
jgi:hypothetical protein